MKTLGFIGMGNMAGAIAAGILQKGLMKKKKYLPMHRIMKSLWQMQKKLVLFHVRI